MNACIITVSDRAYTGVYEDRSGPALSEYLGEQGIAVSSMIIIPDKKNKIIEALEHAVRAETSLILTTGGTGFSPRDITPEATREVIEREAPGIAEYMRMQSALITPHALLSRGVAGIKGKSVIVNLPGSPKGAVENLRFVLPALRHGIDILGGMTE